MRRGFVAVLVSLLLFPGSAFAFQFSTPRLSNAVAGIGTFINNLFTPPTVALHTEPAASAASAAVAATAPTTDSIAAPSSDVAPSAPPATTPAPTERTVYLQPQTIERTIVQAAPLPNDVVRAPVLAQLLAIFESKISAQINAITTPPQFPQQVAGGGNGVFSYGAAAAASTGSGGGGSGGGVSLDQVSSMIASAIQAAFAAIDHLTANTITATNSTLGSATATTLHVTGSTTLDTPLTPASGGTGVSTVPAYGQLLMGQANGTYALVSTSTLGIGGSGTVSSGTQGQFAFYSAAGSTLTSTSTIFLTQSGRIGIGTTSPTASLAVAGDGYFRDNITATGIYLPDTTDAVTGIIFKGSTPYFYNYNPPGTDGGNIFMGGAGNFTMAKVINNYEAARNVGIGPGVLNNLTTGYFNYGMGYNSLHSVTTGAGNVSIGGNANPANTSGFDNIAIGDDALWNNLTSSVNTAIGHLAGQTLLSSGAPGQTTGRNTFLGYGTDVASSASTTLVNSTALGAGAIVTKSYQVVLGGPGTTETVLSGDVLSSGTIYANNVGANLRVKADGTAANDGGVFAGASGAIYFSNYAANRGWLINADGTMNSLGTGAIQTGGSLGVGTVAGSNAFAVSGTGRFSGTLNLDSVGANMRLKADGTAANDAGIFMSMNGDMKIANWNITRGWVIRNTGDIYNLGSGNVGIGTTSPDILLSVGSNVPSGAVAHFENSTGSCYINPTTTSLSCSSDSRLKANVVPLDSADGLAAVLKLNPVTYNWKTESATTSPHTGFIAQDVQPVLPDLVSQGPDGYYTLNYAGLTPYLVKAVQEIATLSDTFKTTLIAWLADAQNGIGDFFAHVGHFDETDTQKLCTTRSDGTQVCITNDQLAAFLSQAAAANPSTSVTSSGTTQASNCGNPGNANSTPPVIAIKGENPATITVGATYADLGATISGPQADVNLGLTIVVDSATSTDGSVLIDTSKPGTHTILYTVTDPNGLTGSATRTVIISAPQQTPPPANNNTTPAANDNSPSDGATGTTGQQ